MEIQTKRDMYPRLRARAFGNCFRVWDSASAVIDAGYTGLLGLRCVGVFGGMPYAHHLRFLRACDLAGRLQADGFEVLFCEASPDSHITLQGELTGQSPCGTTLSYSTEQCDMRSAIRFGMTDVTGPAVWLLLQQYLSLESYDDFRELVDMYPTSVVEFTAYDICVGWARGRTAVVWEVRNY